MSHDIIIIARHGKPALSRKVQLTWREYRKWWAKYDAGGLAEHQKIPKRLRRWTEKADVVISSSLLRAKESAALASGREPDFIFDELIEAPLPSPHLGPLKFRPKTWGTWSRIVWFWGWPDGMESHGQARKRANKMADVLAEHAEGGKIVYVSAHGWFNRMLKGSLKKRGWKCKSQNGDLHWSHRRFERPTGYGD
jgi:broad specificity phosphatase PhoE